MLFNILKTVHIFSVIAWMAGLLYLPRIFVYHAEEDIKKETSETFKIMEKKLFNIIKLNPRKFISKDHLTNDKYRAISDFISGMTDRFAINLYNYFK